MPTMQEFWMKLKSLLSLARLAVNAQLSQLDLTSAAGDIIFHLVGKDAGLSQEELRERLNIGKAAISRTVDQLVRKGYAHRAKNPGDGRACLVTLTEKGRGVSARVSEAYDHVFDIIKRDVPREDLLRVSLLLDLFQRNLTAERAAE